jgi:hypothetical protein
MSDEITLEKVWLELRVNHQGTLDFREHIREKLERIEEQVRSTNGRVTALEHDRTRRDALGWKQIAGAIGTLGVVVGIMVGIVNVVVNIVT